MTIRCSWLWSPSHRESDFEHDGIGVADLCAEAQSKPLGILGQSGRALQCA
jgi:hypothetical protein